MPANPVVPWAPNPRDLRVFNHVNEKCLSRVGRIPDGTFSREAGRKTPTDLAQDSVLKERNGLLDVC